MAISTQIMTRILLLQGAREEADSTPRMDGRATWAMLCPTLAHNLFNLKVLPLDLMSQEPEAMRHSLSTYFVTGLVRALGPEREDTGEERAETHRNHRHPS